MHINSRHLDPAPAVASLRHEYAFALKVRPKAFYIPFFFFFLCQTRHSFWRLHLSPRQDVHVYAKQSRHRLTRASRSSKAHGPRIKLASLSTPVFNIQPPNRTKNTASFYLSWHGSLGARRARVVVYSSHAFLCVLLCAPSDYS